MECIIFYKLHIYSSADFRVNECLHLCAVNNFSRLVGLVVIICLTLLDIIKLFSIYHFQFTPPSKTVSELEIHLLFIYART